MGHSDIPFSNAARNLGVIFDSQLALKEQMNKLCQPAYLEIRPIGSVRQYLSFEDTKILVSLLVLFRLDYCTALLASSPEVLLDKIQRVISCSARLIFKVLRSAHVTPFLYAAHWLPISSRIQYKIALICFHIVSCTAPPHLSCLTSTLLLALFAQPRILASSEFLGWAEGPWVRDPFNTLDLCSGTHLLSLSGIHLHSLLLSQN